MPTFENFKGHFKYLNYTVIVKIIIITKLNCDFKIIHNIFYSQKRVGGLFQRQLVKNAVEKRLQFIPAKFHRETLLKMQLFTGFKNISKTIFFTTFLNENKSLVKVV